MSVGGVGGIVSAVIEELVALELEVAWGTTTVFVSLCVDSFPAASTALT